MINISNIKKTFYSALGEEKAVFNGLNLEINQGDLSLLLEAMEQERLLYLTLLVEI